MNAAEVLRIVDAIHRDKNIEKDIVFEGIEAALVSAEKKHRGEETEVEVRIDRESGDITTIVDGEMIDAEEAVGRIGAQTAKQVMIQKIREAERDALHEEYSELVGEMVSGMIHRYEGGARHSRPQQRRSDPAPQRTNPGRNASCQRTHSSHRV